MALNQLRAVTGKRFRPDLTGSIQARASLLPQLYARKDDQKYQQDTLGMEQQKLDLTRELADRQYGMDQQRIGLMNEEMDEARKREKKAQQMALSNLGMTAGLGLAPYDANVQGMFSPKPKASPEYNKAFSDMESTFGSVGGPDRSFADKAMSASYWSEPKNFTDAATSITPYAMGLTGMGLGSAIGEKILPFGEKENRIAGGAIAGAGLSGLVSGGDPFSAAIGGLIGSIGGWF